MSIAVVRGLDPACAEAADIRRFWHLRGGPEGDAAVERLGQVVCVARDGSGEVAGVNSVVAADVPLVDRRLWVYRSLLTADATDQDHAMVRTAFATLEREFEARPGGPIGMALLIADRREMLGRPQMEWADPPLLYMGHLRDGRQLRVAYFAGATIGPGLDAAPRAPRDGGAYRIAPFADHDSVGEREVLALWEREGAVEPQEARRRLDEVLLVATGEGGALAAIASVYLARNERLGMDFWHFRTFVGRPHREAGLAVGLICAAQDLLRDRYESGEDRRGAGVLVEVENPLLMRGVNQAVWPSSRCVFIGEGPRGEHIRVRPFPGVVVPPPAS